MDEILGKRGPRVGARRGEVVAIRWIDYRGMVALPAPRARADLGHVLTYHFTMAVLVLPVWHDWRAAWFLAISAGTHALVDRRWPTRLVLRSTGSKDFATVFWGVIATDQALHLSILAISVYWLAR
jgi:hypothetical protein